MNYCPASLTSKQGNNERDQVVPIANNPQITIQVILDNYQVLFVIINQPTT